MAPTSHIETALPGIGTTQVSLDVERLGTTGSIHDWYNTPEDVARRIEDDLLRVARGERLWLKPTGPLTLAKIPYSGHGEAEIRAGDDGWVIWRLDRLDKPGGGLTPGGRKALDALRPDRMRALRALLPALRERRREAYLAGLLEAADHLERLVAAAREAAARAKGSLAA